MLSLICVSDSFAGEYKMLDSFSTIFWKFQQTQAKKGSFDDDPKLIFYLNFYRFLAYTAKTVHLLCIQYNCI